MIIWVDDELFTPDAAHDVDRLALLRGAFLRRHTLAVSDSFTRLWTEVTGARRFERWAGGLSVRLRDEVKVLREGYSQVPVNATTRGGGRLLVTRRRLRISDPRCCILDLHTAARVVALPLSILVEDVINDAAFLKRAMPQRWRTKLEQWEDNGDLCFEHGGGLSTMRRILDRFGTTPESSSPQGYMPAAAWRLIHVLVFDHDGETKEQPQRDSRRLAQKCEEMGMADRCHMLERRDQEAYLPKEALDELARRKIPEKGRLGKMLQRLGQHFASPREQRSYRPLPKLGEDPLFKNEFLEDIEWQEEWFADAATEMTELAEKIAAAM